MAKFILSGFADEIDPMLDVQLEEVLKHDIRYIEMRGVDGRNISDYSVEDTHAIKNKLDAAGVRVSAVGSPIGKQKITDDFGPHLELFKKQLEQAKVLEAENIRMFSFFLPAGEDPAKYRDEVMRRWSGFIKAAEGTGVCLLHENEKDIYGDLAIRCLDLVETLGSDKVKLIFDPANFIQCNENNYPHAYELLKDYIVYMHIKDAVRSDGHVVPAGYGDGCVREILSALKARNFEGFLSLEPHLSHFVGFDALEPGSPRNTMPEGGKKSFAIAADSLKKLLSEI